jgi:transcriptional regulator with XRE-family HTH domain
MDESEVMLISDARLALASGKAATIRKAARLTQAEMAGICGVSAAAYTLWEAGTRRPRGDAALRLGRLLRALETRAGVPA